MLADADADTELVGSSSRGGATLALDPADVKVDQSMGICVVGSQSYVTNLNVQISHLPDQDIDGAPLGHLRRVARQLREGENKYVLMALDHDHDHEARRTEKVN